MKILKSAIFVAVFSFLAVAGLRVATATTITGNPVITSVTPQQATPGLPSRSTDRTLPGQVW
jgi:hypothetical protein